MEMTELTTGLEKRVALAVFRIVFKGVKGWGIRKVKVGGASR